MPEHDPITAYLAELERSLPVHGRRRERILVEAEQHLRESAALIGPETAIHRFGPARSVAAAYRPRALDRAFAQRDRLAALLMLSAMAACLPLAVELARLGRHIHSHAWIWLFALLAPTAAMALASNLLVLLRRPLGVRLVRPLAVMVAVTALWMIVEAPPVAAEFSAYRQAVQHGYQTSGCGGRSLAACAADHSDEIRLNFTFGAVCLTLLYAWAVTGRPRIPRLRGRARPELA